MELSDEQQAFMAAIIERPDDDAPRLIYADWLDEHASADNPCAVCKGNGELGFDSSQLRDETIYCPYCYRTGRVSNGFAEQAELIRVQCELARKPQPPILDPADHGGGQHESYLRFMKSECRWCALEARERQLLTADRGRDWSEGLPRPTERLDGTGGGPLNGHTGVVWRRGFVDEVHLRHEQFVADGPALALQFPVRRWILRDRAPWSSFERHHWFRSSWDREERLSSDSAQPGAGNLLHPALFDLLPNPGDGVYLGVALFDSARAALEALEQACLQYVRGPRKESSHE